MPPSPPATMKVLSIDVGIKNLACCLFSVENGNCVEILNWEVLNIMGAPGVFDAAEEASAAAAPTQCNFMIKRGKKKGAAGCPCGKSAIYMTPQAAASAAPPRQYRCTAHAKKEPGYIMPTADLKPAAIKRCNMTQLCDLAAKYQIAYTKPIKKAALAAAINDYAAATCMQPIIDAAAVAQQPRAPNAKQICMIKLGRHLKQHLDVFLGDNVVDHVAIEKQMTARMKMIQCMIAQYFIMTSPAAVVAFVSATHKLEAGDLAAATDAPFMIDNDSSEDDDDADDDVASTISDDEMAGVTVEDIVRKMKHRTYKKRKSTGIEYCLADLKNIGGCAVRHIEFMQKHKKQDDLADCYLQGRWYIRKVRAGEKGVS